jgi:hypothetical protein
VVIIQFIWMARVAAKHVVNRVHPRLVLFDKVQRSREDGKFGSGTCPPAITAATKCYYVHPLHILAI